MEMSHKIGHAPRTTATATEIAQLHGPCVGCFDCRGLCAELIEALTLPDIILARKGTA